MNWNISKVSWEITKGPHVEGTGFKIWSAGNLRAHKGFHLRWKNVIWLLMFELCNWSCSWTWMRHFWMGAYSAFGTSESLGTCLYGRPEKALPCFFLSPVIFFTKSFFIMVRRRTDFELSWLSSRAEVCLPPSHKAGEGWAQTLTLGCVSVHSMRCQSILHMAMFGYKKDTAMRYSRLLNDHFKVGHRYH